MKKGVKIVIGLCLCVSLIFAGDWNFISKITADDRTSGDYFSNDLAISGNFAIVGAYHESQSVDEGGFLSETGAAYIFRFNGSAWEQMQKLTAPVRIEEDHFGYSVDICGNYAIVGAPRKDDTDTDYGEGVAFIYYYDGSTWVLQEKLLSDDRQIGDHFGYHVALTENRAAIGAPYKDIIHSPSDTTFQAGAVYVFSRSGTNWTQTGKVTASDAGFDDRLGLRVDIDGSYLVASTPYEAHDADSMDYEVYAGAAYVYYHGATGWEQQKKLVASDRDMGDFFGYSVAIDGSHIVVGAYMEDHDPSGANRVEKAGSAYIFTHGVGGWTETQKIVGSERWASDFFGRDVDIQDDLIIIGADGEDHDPDGNNYVPAAGAAYIFKNIGGNWLEQEKIAAPVRSEDDAFGNEVAIWEDIVLIGALGEDHDSDEGDTKNGAGAAYIFSTGIGGTVEPDIMVMGNGLEIANGDATPSLDDHTNFDTTQVSAGTLIRHFELHNTGSGYLHIDSLYFDGFHAEDFAFVEPLPDSIAPGTFDILTISLTPSVVGRRNTVVYIQSDDPDESPYSFDIMGAGKLPYSGGSGTELDPYLITCSNDLIELSESDFDWDKWFLQTQDIDMSITDSMNIESIEGMPGPPTYLGFSPIGDSPTEGDRQQVAFSGVYNGGGHKISNLHIERSNEHTVGVFGYVKDVTHTGHTAIRNVFVEDIFAIGSDYVGGLVGWNIDAWIDSCIVSGSVSTGFGAAGGLVGFDQEEIHNCHTMVYTSGDPAGGLVGYKEFGHIVNSSAHDTVFSIGSSAGGLVGRMYQGDIANSYSDAYVIGFNYTGGLVGRISNLSKIENCYSKGKVSGQPTNMFSSTGGFIGLAEGAIVGLGCLVENCYSLTEVEILSTSGITSQGFIGSTSLTNTFLNNFFNVNTSGQLSDTSNASTALDSTAMLDLNTYTNTTTEGLDAAWDFAYQYNDDTGDEDLWDIDTTRVLNDGYPFLFWENGDLISLPEPEVAIADIGLPDDSALLPAYPNPFNPITAISYQLSDNCYAELNIYSIQGKLVDRLIQGYMNAGKYELTWDASDMPSGVYIVRMEAGEFLASRKIVLMK